MAVTTNGKSRKLPMFEVILRNLTNEAARGDKSAVKLLLALIDRAGGMKRINERATREPIPEITPDMSVKEAAALYERSLRRSNEDFDES